jgi:hypothetical protein
MDHGGARFETQVRSPLRSAGVLGLLRENESLELATGERCVFAWVWNEGPVVAQQAERLDVTTAQSFLWQFEKLDPSIGKVVITSVQSDLEQATLRVLKIHSSVIFVEEAHPDEVREKFARPVPF